jgi:cell division protein FtsX
MKRLVVLTVVVIAVLTGGLALYLFWLGTLLNRIADNLEDSTDLVRRIDDNAKVIRPGVAHINEVGGVVAGALPLLYGMAEQVVQSTAGQTVTPSDASAASTPGTRRSRHHEGVGFIPPG